MAAYMLSAARYTIDFIAALVFLRGSIDWFDIMRQQWQKPATALGNLMICYDLWQKYTSNHLTIWDKAGVVLGGRGALCRSPEKRTDMIWTVGHGAGFWLTALCITWVAVDVLVFSLAGVLRIFCESLYQRGRRLRSS
jgi:hypothetical protein